MKKLLLGAVGGALIVGSASFYGGIKYAQNKSSFRMSSGRTGADFRSGTAGRRGSFDRNDNNAENRTGGNRGAGFVNGEIIAAGEKSLTVKLREGGSKIILLSASTTIGKVTAGATSDLTAGQTVGINGESNADGSITAVNIQIRPR